MKTIPTTDDDPRMHAERRDVEQKPVVAAPDQFGASSRPPYVDVGWESASYGGTRRFSRVVRTF